MNTGLGVFNTSGVGLNVTGTSFNTGVPGVGITGSSAGFPFSFATTQTQTGSMQKNIKGSPQDGGEVTAVAQSVLLPQLLPKIPEPYPIPIIPNKPTIPINPSPTCGMVNPLLSGPQACVTVNKQTGTYTVDHSGTFKLF